MKSVTREEIEQAVSPLRWYSTYKPLQITLRCETTHNCNILKLHKKMDSKQCGRRRRTEKEANITKGTERKSRRKIGFTAEEKWLLSSFLFFSVSCYIIDQAKMWIDYAVTATVIPFWMNWIFDSVCYLCSQFFAVPFGSNIIANSSSPVLTIIIWMQYLRIGLFLNDPHNYSAS